jgi:hypothetical protein
MFIPLLMSMTIGWPRMNVRAAVKSAGDSLDTEAFPLIPISGACFQPVGEWEKGEWG